MVHEEKEICSACKLPVNQCICCPECGHDCLLEIGELYCPICFPEPKQKHSA